MKQFFAKELTDEQWTEIIDEAKIYFEQDAAFKRRRIDHISKFIDNLPEDQIDVWMDKFLKWEEKYEEYCYDVRHIQTTSQIFAGLTDYIEEKGKEIRNTKKEIFFAGGWKWKDYTFRIYCGQGCFWRIWRKRTVIFQTT